MPLQQITANDILNGTITGSDIASGTITGSNISANTISNTAFQTGSVENYMSAQGSQLGGMRNRIINGAMVIDQRNAGASVSGTADTLYNLDRWCGRNTGVSARYSVQQSSVAPAGYSNSLLVTSLGAYSLVTSDKFVIEQRIEGFNSSDLSWGTSNAATVTLSFWARSSLTGTFGGAIRSYQSAGSGCYPFSYAINAANTWEYKTVVIPGPSIGTWVSNNGGNIVVGFGIGVASDICGTPGSWVAAEKYSSTGATSVVGTNGATFYITGVQLEKGATATPFENRLYGTELALCQRYFERISANSGNVSLPCFMNGTTSVDALATWKVPKRSEPTVTGSTGSNSYTGEIGSVAFTTNGFTGAFQMSSYGVRVRSISTTSFTNAYAGHLVLSGSAYIDGNSEL